MRKLKKRLKNWLNQLAKDNVRARGVIRWCMNAYGLLHYRLTTFWLGTDDHTVLFASFDGRAYSDSPRAIFEHMVRSREFEGCTLVWGVRKAKVAKLRKTVRKLREEVYPEIAGIPSEKLDAESLPGPKIVVVGYNGKQWRRYLATAKYWVLNFKVPDYLRPKRDQVFLQTWHGTPLKRLGYDLEHFDNVLNTREGMQRRYGLETEKFSWFVSPSPFATEKFKSAWRMEEHGKDGIILQTGYPRNDILTTHTPSDVDRIKARIFGHFYLPYEQKVKRPTIVLYAPTYRSDHHESGKGYTYDDELDFERLRAEFGDDVIVLFRTHWLIAGRFDFERYAGFVYNVSGYDDMSDLYLISDVLITDYSSSMFDFSILKRPMIFYMYDLEHYRDESNGFYFDPEEVLPGPIVRTEDELVGALHDVVEGRFAYDERYERFNERFNSLEDGHASERVVNAVLDAARDR